MSGGHEEAQYIPAMKLMWDEVEKRFDPKYILGEAGHQFCQTYAVRASHAEFPYALHRLSLICPLMNGGRVSVFPTAPSPLTLVAINVNYAQTRKSSLTGHAEALGPSKTQGNLTAASWKTIFFRSLGDKNRHSLKNLLGEASGATVGGEGIGDTVTQWWQKGLNHFQWTLQEGQGSPDVFGNHDVAVGYF